MHSANEEEGKNLSKLNSYRKTMIFCAQFNLANTNTVCILLFYTQSCAIQF